MLFIRLNFKEPKDKKINHNHRIAVLSIGKKICAFYNKKYGFKVAEDWDADIGWYSYLMRQAKHYRTASSEKGLEDFDFDRAYKEYQKSDLSLQRRRSKMEEKPDISGFDGFDGL